MAQQQDDKEDESAVDIPEEIKRRKDRLAKIDRAKKVIEQQRKESYKEEKAEFDQKLEANQRLEDTRESSKRTF